MTPNYKYNHKNKDANIRSQMNYLLTRTLNMFEYTGLPDTLPATEIEKQLQVNGHGFVTEHEGELYIFQGGFGGEPDVYGNSTQFIVNNPALKFNATLDIGTQGILMNNDDMVMGLMPLMERYVYMMVENDISMVLNSYNNRVQTLISAGDSSTKESADLYLKKIIDGDLGVVGESRIFDGIKVHGAQNQGNSFITQMIEYQQYLKGSLYNEIGLNANFNMKRERLTSSETNLNLEALYPFIDDMLQCRQEAVEKINELYNLDISVEFGSVWKNRNDNAESDLEETEWVLGEEVEPEPEPEPELVIEETEIVELEETVEEETVEELVEELEELVEEIVEEVIQDDDSESETDDL